MFSKIGAILLGALLISIVGVGVFFYSGGKFSVGANPAIGSTGATAAHVQTFSLLRNTTWGTVTHEATLFGKGECLTAAKAETAFTGGLYKFWCEPPEGPNSAAKVNNSIAYSLHISGRLYAVFNNGDYDQSWANEAPCNTLGQLLQVSEKCTPGPN